MRPLVSVVVPCYNHALYIQECIQSVINQDYHEIELIIIDDGSSDDSVAKIEELTELCEKRFLRFEFRSRPNKGLCNTLNEAMEWCSGEFYSAIASDDVLISDKTTRQVSYLTEKPDCIAVFGSVQVVGADGRNRRKVMSKPMSFSFEDIFLSKSFLPAPTQMIRMDKLRNSGGYRPDLYIEDWYMWLKLTESGGSVDNIGVVLACYRRHDSNISSQLNKMESARIQIVNLFSTNNMYSLAMANALIQSAIDSQLVSKAHSWALFFSALKINYKALFQVRCLKYAIKSIIPKKSLARYFAG